MIWQRPQAEAGLLAGRDLAWEDAEAAAGFATHHAWLPSNRWGIECIANLDRLPATGATLVVGAPKHRGGSGGPCRVFAMA